jgi:ABC-type multidrug transport system permease subunit
MISTYLQKANVSMLNNLSNILGIALLFIPPVYYPEERLGSFSWLAIIFPTSNTASLIRAASGMLQLSQEMIIVRFLVLLCTLVFSIFAVSLKSKWREA